MSRWTVELDPDLDIRLKLESMRSRRPEADVIREALEVYLKAPKDDLPPGVGEFSSGHTDTAEKAEELLKEWGFGEESHDRSA